MARYPPGGCDRLVAILNEPCLNIALLRCLAPDHSGLEANVRDLTIRKLRDVAAHSPIGAALCRALGSVSHAVTAPGLSVASDSAARGALASS